MEKAITRLFPVIIVLLVVASACVAPPKPSSASNSSANASQPGATGSALATTPTPQYVTLETPVQTLTPLNTKTATATATTPPPYVWVEIYRTKQYFSFNQTAFSFDLKNPPMLIHYNVVPVNVTGTREIWSHWDAPGGPTIETITYDYYSPYSWFEVTVRNKNTGQVLLQDGFGNSYGKQYSQDINRTLKVLNRGNVLIQLDGNLITATVDVKVKKDENIA